MIRRPWRETVGVHEVQETKLPGVGVRHEFATDRGQQLGVLVHHDGRRELLVYDQDDPDACSSVIKLTQDDTHTLGDLLGTSQVVEEVVEAQHEVDGQSIAWIQVPSGCSVEGTSIGAGEYRTRTGASIVAVIRRGEPVPVPDPAFVLEGQDLVIAVGTASSLDQLRSLLRP